jgi:hypothetical protein
MVMLPHEREVAREVSETPGDSGAPSQLRVSKTLVSGMGNLRETVKECLVGLKRDEEVD